jgi:hypothetical protein
MISLSALLTAPLCLSALYFLTNASPLSTEDAGSSFDPLKYVDPLIGTRNGGNGSQIALVI